jgi:hypothetical protein
MNATLGQYQSFALIAFSALRQQASNVATTRSRGSDVSESMEVLYSAYWMAQTVYNYSINQLSNTTITENEIIAICDWLKTTLLFNCDSIPDLPNTYFTDFNLLDFNLFDFA